MSQHGGRTWDKVRLESGTRLAVRIERKHATCVYTYTFLGPLPFGLVQSGR